MTIAKVIYIIACVVAVLGLFGVLAFEVVVLAILGLWSLAKSV